MIMDASQRKRGEPLLKCQRISSLLLSSRAKGPVVRNQKRSRSGICGEEGATLVEFAFASMIFVMILFGIIEVSLAVYSYDFVSEAARDAARYAIVRGANCKYMPDCGATNSTIQTHVQSLNYPGINTSNLTTTTVWYSHATAPPNMTWTTCGTTQCDAIGNAVKVTVNYSFPLQVPFYPGSTINLTNSSMMVISQ
jgi:Flp pilus assembly protein TadG